MGFEVAAISEMDKKSDTLRIDMRLILVQPTNHVILKLKLKQPNKIRSHAYQGRTSVKKKKPAQ